MLADLFKTEERVSILRYVMFSRALNVAGVSRATGVTKGLVSRYLRLLVVGGLLQRDGRRYSPLDGYHSRAVRLLLNLDGVNPSALSLGSASGICLYGRSAGGTNRYILAIEYQAFVYRRS